MTDTPSGDAGMAPPPPPPPEPMEPLEGVPQSAGVPPEPGAPRKKRRTWLIVAVAVAIVAVLAGSAFGVWLVREGQRAESVDEVMERIEAVGEELEAASNDFDAAYWSFEETTGSFPDAFEAFSSEVELINSDMQEMTEDMRHAADQLTDSPLKEALLEAIEEVELLWTAMQTVSDECAALVPFGKGMDEATALVDEATELVNTSIEKSNKDEYDGALADAKKAKRLYKEARKKLREIGELYPEFDLTLLIAVVDKDIEQAEVAAEVVTYADAGRYSDYDEAVDRYNELGREIRNAELPEWIDDTTALFAPIDEAWDEFLMHAFAATEAITRVEERFNAGQY